MLLFRGTACTAESILLSATEGFREARRVVTMLLRLAGEDDRPEHRSDHLQALLRISSQNMVAVKVHSCMRLPMSALFAPTSCKYHVIVRSAAI